MSLASTTMAKTASVLPAPRMRLTASASKSSPIPRPRTRRSAGQSPDKCYRNGVIARKSPRHLLQQIFERQHEGTQTVKPDDAQIVVLGDEDPRDITSVVLAGAMEEPTIEIRLTTREKISACPSVAPTSHNRICAFSTVA